MKRQGVSPPQWRGRRLLMLRQWRHLGRGICLIIATWSDLHNQFLTVLCYVSSPDGWRNPREAKWLIWNPWAFAFSLWMPIFLQSYLWSDIRMASSHFFHALLSYNWQVQIVHVQGMHWLDTDTHCNDCYDQINGQSTMTHIYSCVCMPRWGHLRVTFFANSIK